MKDKVILTKEAFEKLIAGLVYLEEEKNNIVDDYFPAATSQRAEITALIEDYIAQVDGLIKSIEVAGVSDNTMPFVIIGSEVSIKDLNSQNAIKLKITLPLQECEGNHASCLSPMGMSLLLKGVGEIISAYTPNGAVKYKIEWIILQ